MHIHFVKKLQFFFVFKIGIYKAQLMCLQYELVFDYLSYTLYIKLSAHNILDLFLFFSCIPPILNS